MGEMLGRNITFRGTPRPRYIGRYSVSPVYRSNPLVYSLRSKIKRSGEQSTMLRELLRKCRSTFFPTEHRRTLKTINQAVPLVGSPGADAHYQRRLLLDVLSRLKRRWKI
jgi:hypothetical protein